MQVNNSKLKKLKHLQKFSKKLLKLNSTPALDSLSNLQPSLTSNYFSSENFQSLPILQETKSAVANILNYSQLTQIQAKCIPHLLKGRDLLGAAKTGSGKTLAFLIPAIELLAKSRFETKHGTGIIIIAPTRELAWQIFTKLNELLTYQSRTHGLLIGGVNRKIEAERLKKGMNIVVATPGRLLDHLENTKGFAVHNLLCLIIDEADALLKIGFEEEMNRILQLIPNERQTVLFSATQTKKVEKLARLSLKQPIYVGVDDSDALATVEGLEQGFVVCESDKRFLLLFTLVQRFAKLKVMVFFSSCNSVKFFADLFNYVDVPVLEIHGKQKQTKRQNTYFEFCNAEKGILFCTDVAARGLDIPAVDWIIQYDPPDETKEYIHRVGRTCRGANARGKALIFLLPSELDYLKHLRMAKVTLNEYEFPEEKLINIQQQFDNLIDRNYYLHKAAFEGYKSYLHAYSSHALKDVFDVNKLDLYKVGRSFHFFQIFNIAFRFGFNVPPRVNLSLLSILFLLLYKDVKVSGKTVRQNKIASFKGGSKSLLYKGRDRHLIQKSKNDPDKRQFSR